jgi:hypothetical protein
MDYEAELDRAEQHVREGENLVARQRELIRELAANNHPTALAEEILHSLEASLASHREHRDHLRIEVARNK